MCFEGGGDMVELAIMAAYLLILAVGGCIADYILPHIPFVERYIESLPAFDDDEEGGGDCGPV
ncbi:hypothetical protein D7V91_11410 [bacterium 1xD42-67]|nr:hypothetical protein D7V91_11410 [bacterium 1xD42-67]